MIVSGGKVISIDRVNHDETLTGDGAFVPLGVNPSAFKNSVYFSATSGANKNTEYFNFNTTTQVLSASPDICFFNIAVNYSVNATSSVCPDFVYNSNIKFNGINHSHYLNGCIPEETYSFSYNIDNRGSNHSYKIVPENDNGIEIKNIRISCIGFTDETDEPVIIPVLGANGGILSFNGNQFLGV